MFDYIEEHDLDQPRTLPQRQRADIKEIINDDWAPASRYHSVTDCFAQAREGETVIDCLMRLDALDRWKIS